MKILLGLLLVSIVKRSLALSSLSLGSNPWLVIEILSVLGFLLLVWLSNYLPSGMLLVCYIVLFIAVGFFLCISRWVLLTLKGLTSYTSRGLGLAYDLLLILQIRRCYIPSSAYCFLLCFLMVVSVIISCFSTLVYAIPCVRSVNLHNQYTLSFAMSNISIVNPLIAPALILAAIPPRESGGTEATKGVSMECL